MKITAREFETYLKCPTKCWLRVTGETFSGNIYSEWTKTQSQLYRATGIERLFAVSLDDDIAISPDINNIKVAKWRLASSLTVQAKMDFCALESELHAVERLTTEARGKPAQFVPIRFIFANKLNKDDKLLMAFDVVVFSKSLGCEVNIGKIIHGNNHANTKLKTTPLVIEVQDRIKKIADLLSCPIPPDLVLIPHCVECEFQAYCRQKAVENDDLSLLSSMTAKERQKLRNKGIFTVTQLSYTFRPRRRPKQFRSKREKYHHSLKALAIREKRIHIVGNPKLNIEGTPVYLDIESLPDQDFYYLIGLRISKKESTIQHSLWADTIEDEAKIWLEFLAILETIEKPVLVHYGSYESTFLHKMQCRYEIPLEDSPVAKTIHSSMNVLTVIYGQVYFPTYSNGIKDVASWLNFTWDYPSLNGTNSIATRSKWQQSKDPSLKIRLVNYNTDDCHAVEIVVMALSRLNSSEGIRFKGNQSLDTVQVAALKRPHRRFGDFESIIQGFDEINQAAWWNYQRDRIYVKSNCLRSKHKQLLQPRRRRINKVVNCPVSKFCQFCKTEFLPRNHCTRTLYDLHFGKSMVKGWIVEYRFWNYWCPKCQRRFGTPDVFWPQSKYGRNLVAFLLYEAIELCIPIISVVKTVNRFFGLAVPQRTFYALRDSAAKQYKSTYERIIEKLTTRNMLHVDETRVSNKGKVAYVWVFATFNEVAYLYSDTREGDLLHSILKEYKGVVVSDFYGVYDSLACPQQKCLVHLMRDLNDAVLSHPYDESLKEIVMDFGAILKDIVETIGRYGLKTRFLRKHRRSVDRFFKRLSKRDCQTEASLKCKLRFEKNRYKLFTFLSYDNVPWNNNNAEHAIRGFARLRDILGGKCTANSIKNYLILLSLCQTCKYMDVDFFDFFRSGEKDIYAFAK